MIVGIVHFGDIVVVAHYVVGCIRTGTCLDEVPLQVLVSQFKSLVNYGNAYPLLLVPFKQLPSIKRVYTIERPLFGQARVVCFGCFFRPPGWA